MDAEPSNLNEIEELDEELRDQLVDRFISADAYRDAVIEQENERQRQDDDSNDQEDDVQSKPNVIRNIASEVIDLGDDGPQNVALVELSDEYDETVDDTEDFDQPSTSRKRKRSEDVEYKPELSSDEEDVVEKMEEVCDSAEDEPTISKPLKKVTLIEKVKDDGDTKVFNKRIKKLKADEEEETAFKDLDEQFKIPRKVWNKLFSYQKYCIQWMWELHQAGVGGIIGDEMGLGKTIQIIAFLSGLHSSSIKNLREPYESLGPVIIVCPATVMHQWVQEFRIWCPLLRVAILHSSGTYTAKNKKPLIKLLNQTNGILITTYQGVVDHQDSLLHFDWHYVILDEGHKIRNPDAQVTLACKRFKTPHRIILSGSPIQNNLKELWSLFDFVYPGLLGTLPVFTEQFAVPITQGGYANASEVQVQVAFRCATVLRDTIKPYFLRRLKEDVKSKLNLPDKNEQVLFCRLTDEQREVYERYLKSDTIRDIVKGSTQLFVGLTNLRKICNHPDLFSVGVAKPNSDSEFGYYKLSGKMQVVNALLKVWSKQNHKVLLFTQGTQMKTLIEKYLLHREYTYLSMDGSTPIGSRQQLITQFNNDENVFVFLLTTRVGGLGVNLTGASRVLIFDPDWNPSTDLQARERAWRIGQQKKVTIYRLLTSGTIEEKIYHRQVFKQYLSNRVLKNPKQRRFFKTNDLYELFSLGNDSKSTETSAIFAGTGSDVKVDHKAKNPNERSKAQPTAEESSTDRIELPQEKIDEIRERAKRLSQMLSSFKRTDTATTSSELNHVNGSIVPTISNLKQEQLEKPEKSISGNITIAEKEKKNKKKGKKKGAVFEGERIKYLVKHDKKKYTEDTEMSKKQDDYVLKKLFKGNSVHSALQHDVIEGAANPDYAIVEREAEKVALAAINALKKSKADCFRASSGIPSWTGLNGHKKAPRQPGNNVANGESSSSLLTAIKSRHKLDNLEDDDGEHPGAFVEPQNKELIENIRTFVASRPFQQAHTNEVLDKFKDALPIHQTPVFKALLNNLCSFARRSDGVGIWTLKSEFS